MQYFVQDVLLLAQFISPEGNILNRRITGNLMPIRKIHFGT
jgi:ribosomal protein S18